TLAEELAARRGAGRRRDRTPGLIGLVAAPRGSSSALALACLFGRPPLTHLTTVTAVAFAGDGRHPEMTAAPEFLSRGAPSRLSFALRGGGAIPTSPSASFRNSSARCWICRSTAAQVAAHASSETPAGRGVEQTSTYALAFGSVPDGRSAIRADSPSRKIRK